MLSLHSMFGVKPGNKTRNVQCSIHYINVT